jgi:hypothetical protein
MSRHIGSRRRLVLALALATSAFAGGCDTLGNGRALTGTPSELSRTVVINRSTRDEVRAALGDASVYRYKNGAESWTYRETHGLPRFVEFVPFLSFATLVAPPKVVEVALLFDPQGVLRRVDWRTPA